MVPAQNPERPMTRVPTSTGGESLADLRALAEAIRDSDADRVDFKSIEEAEQKTLGLAEVLCRYSTLPASPPAEGWESGDVNLAHGRAYIVSQVHRDWEAPFRYAKDGKWEEVARACDALERNDCLLRATWVRLRAETEGPVVRHELRREDDQITDEEYAEIARLAADMDPSTNWPDGPDDTRGFHGVVAGKWVSPTTLELAVRLLTALQGQPVRQANEDGTSNNRIEDYAASLGAEERAGEAQAIRAWLDSIHFGHAEGDCGPLMRYFED